MADQRGRQITSFAAVQPPEGRAIGWARALRRRPEPVAACPCAGEPRETQRLALCQAGFGRVTLGFRAFPFTISSTGACSARHFADAAFPVRLRDALLSGAAVPAARWSDPKQPRCGRCGSRSWLGRRPRSEVGGIVRLDPLEPFQAFVVGPGDQCASCRLAQIIPTPEVIADLDRALARIFEAARLVR